MEVRTSRTSVGKNSGACKVWKRWALCTEHLLELDLRLGLKRTV
jgi:hypothetical protein